MAALASQLEHSGTRVTVVTLDTLPGESKENGVRVVRLKSWFPIASVISFPGFGASRKIMAAFRNDGVTAVSTHTRFFPMSFIGVRVARGLGVPVIHTEHGSGFVRGVSPLVAWASRIVDHTVGRFVLRSSDKVLSVSESVAGFVKRLSGRASEVFYNAIDLPEAPAVTAARAMRFVYVGRVVPGKGWDDLLRAAHSLIASKQVAAFTVELLGDGPSMPALRSMVNELELSSVVTVRGHVAVDEVLDALRGAVLVNATRLSEGFQTSLLEALAAGSQIVSYQAPGIDQLVSEGAPIRIVQVGDLVGLAAAMRQSLEAPMHAFDTEQLKKWSWPERADQFAEILARVTCTQGAAS